VSSSDPDAPSLTAMELSEFRAALLDWYEAARRDLPWRAHEGEPGDPYRIWVSEVMLQQTRVETVRPYFEKWIRRFPDVHALADAPADEVMKHWEGLGYYSRARNLHQAVREVAHRYGGKVPNDAATLRSLPGIGRYTSGAVLSIAFGQCEPLVDGNVRRVFARVLDSPDPNAEDQWDLAARLVRGERPGDLNQAMMELGATVCTPRSPDCGACPVRSYCRALAGGTVNDRPQRKARVAVPTERVAVAVVASEGRFLLVKKSARGRLGGLWEFPNETVLAGENGPLAALRAAAQVGVAALGLELAGTVTHVMTHVRLAFEVFRGDGTAGAVAAADSVWVSSDRMYEYPRSKAHQRIAALVF
jgi:A/G-specific adenine glycosylase